MAAKLDKDLFKKHHFWFLFGAIALGLLISWIGLFADVPDAVDETKQKYEQQKNMLANIKAQPKQAIDRYGEQLKSLDGQKGVMWREGWNEQKELFKWPSGYTAQQLAVFENLKFGDDIRNVPEQVRTQFRDAETYQREYKELVTSVEPIRFGKNNDWQSVLRYVKSWGQVPSSEDMWLAMEDLWVQREIIQAIHKINVDAAKFEIVGKKDDPKHRQFKSRLWEIDLQVVDVKGKRVLKGKLKNVSGRLQVLGIGNILKLKVWLASDLKAPFIFEIEGTSVEADAQMDIKTIGRHALPDEWKVNEIAAVEQIFDVRTVPIKQINVMDLGKLSDRNKDLALRMPKFSEALAKTDAPPPPKVGGIGEGGMPPAVAPLQELSQSGLRRYRYMDVTDQLRRMSVGMVILADQSCMKDILEALVNIKLRFQMTQVDWVRFHDTLNYASGPGGGPAPMGEGNLFKQSSTPSSNREDQFSANLMELTVFGIVSLYERYPEAKKK